MVLGIISFIFACAGIYGFYNDIYILTYIGFGLSIFECILGKIEGTLKSMQTTIIASIIGWIVVGEFWLGVAIGVCFENVIMFIGGCLMIIIGSSITSSVSQKDNYNNSNNEDTIAIMEETTKKAKKDLETGIKREELDKLLKKGHITQDVYDETIQNIKKLEMIANWDITEIKNNFKNNNKDS